MGSAIITIKLMPESPETDLETITQSAKDAIESFTGLSGEMKTEIEPVAFGLKALNITFVMKEEAGSPDELETTLVELEGVQSASVTDVRRALG